MLVRFVLQLVVNGVALWLADYLLEGITYSGDIAMLAIIALVFGALNALIKPIILLLTLPITVITLGLFALVINAVMLIITSAIFPAYNVDGFWNALLGSILISIVSTVLNWFIPD